MSRLKKGGALGAILVAMTASAEGLRTKAYRDPVGIPTVCYGETKGIRMGMTFTKPQCDAMLVTRLNEFADGVEKCVTRPLPDGPFAAFTDFSYNAGVAGFCNSSMARHWNAGRRAEACNALLAWNKARVAGVLVPLPGLTKRRQHERDLCLKDVL